MAGSFQEQPVPFALAAGSTQGDLTLCSGCHSSAVGATCRTHAGSEPRVASTDESTLFSMSFTMITKVHDSDQAVSDWTKRVEDIEVKYSGNCLEGVLVRAYHTATFSLEVACRLSSKRHHVRGGWAHGPGQCAPRVPELLCVAVAVGRSCLSSGGPNSFLLFQTFN